MKRQKGASSTHTMTLMDHVRELRTRLFVVAAAFLAGSIISYMYLDQVIHVLLAPLDGRKLIYLNPAGGFSFIFLVSIYAGIALAVPLLIQQLYGFVKPILPVNMRRYSWRILLASFILLISGIVFGYFVAIPGALKFLYEFAGDYIQASLTADSYLNFVIAYTIGIGLVFQLPLFLLLIHWIKPFTPKGLFLTERWVIVLAFVAAAIITPTPDPLNQTIIALPIIIVYQLGVVVILIAIRKARKQKAHALPEPTIARPAPEPIRSPLVTPSVQKKTPLRSIDGTFIVTRQPQPVVKSVPPRESSSRLPQYSPRSLSPRRPSMSLDGVSRILPT